MAYQGCHLWKLQLWREITIQPSFIIRHIIWVMQQQRFSTLKTCQRRKSPARARNSSTVAEEVVMAPTAISTCIRARNSSNNRCMGSVGCSTWLNRGDYTYSSSSSNKIIVVSNMEGQSPYHRPILAHLTVIWQVPGLNLARNTRLLQSLGSSNNCSSQEQGHLLTRVKQSLWPLSPLFIKVSKSSRHIRILQRRHQPATYW